MKSGSRCFDERAGIPNSIKDAVLESIHLTHPGIWGMVSLSQYACWPYMHREIFAKTSDCVPCTDIDASTVPADAFLDNAGWINTHRSDLEIEKTNCQAQQDAGRRYRDADNFELRFIIHPKICNPIPRTEAS